MATNGSFGITIKAFDQASKTIDGINKKIASMTAPMDRLNSQLRKFADTTGLKSIASAFANVASAIEGVALSMARLMPVFGALIGAGMVAGFAKLIGSTAEMGSNLSMMAEQIGITTDKLYRFRTAAKLAGSTAAAMDSTLKAISFQRTEALNGNDPNMMRLATATNIDLHKSPDEILKQALDVSRGLKGDQRMRFLQAMHIDESLIRMGDDAGGYLRKASKFQGPDTGALIKVRESIVELQESFENLGNMLVTAFGPQLTHIMDQMSAWLTKDENRTWLKEQIDKLVEAVKEGMPKIEGFAKKLDEWTPTIKQVGQALELYVIAKLFSINKMLGVLGLTIMGLEEFGTGKGDFGSWIDEHIPGAGALDDWFARHMGIGRDRKKQQEMRKDLSAADLTMTPERRAFADTVAEAEGADYDTRYGGSKLDLTGPHPGNIGPGMPGYDPNTPHSPAGRYQITHGTWQEGIKALGIKDVISKENQDKVFAWILARHGVTQEMLADPTRYREVLDKLGPQEWASLPGSVQQRMNINQFNRSMFNNLQRERGTEVNGNIKIDINHANTPPPGFGMSIRGIGAAFGDAAVAMPQWGMP